MSPEKFLPSRIRSIRTAFAGLRQVLVSQPNARIHALITLIVFIMAFSLGLDRLEWTSLLLVIGLVWTAEIFNTSMEALLDWVRPERSEQARIIKDICAAAVLISALISILVGVLIFGPKLWSLIRDLLAF